ncbi:C4-dicarboxylate ABC transporter [Salicibibacter halophilus]|uniref:C4-dicarboxylate ABC transporter n=1 Tax=Salicibibacter halophilus TaxID=2502791 RepID=A0A514LFS9_9BACI|nr:C4-dicarboxylate ABC transporter [Salicibibacter halophilus]QDI90722.1 C4-dicarboxylate ABC transporter [Salicibibacter halophilus]
MNETTGQWLGWIGIIAAVIGFFAAPIFWGIVAVVLGLIALATPQKALAWIAIGLGAVSLIIIPVLF